jgi:hypothetical protein
MTDESKDRIDQGLASRGFVWRPLIAGIKVSHESFRHRETFQRSEAVERPVAKCSTMGSRPGSPEHSKSEILSLLPSPPFSKQNKLSRALHWIEF